MIKLRTILAVFVVTLLATTTDMRPFKRRYRISGIIELDLEPIDLLNDQGGTIAPGTVTAPIWPQNTCTGCAEGQTCQVFYKSCPLNKDCLARNEECQFVPCEPMSICIGEILHIESSARAADEESNVMSIETYYGTGFTDTYRTSLANTIIATAVDTRSTSVADTIKPVAVDNISTSEGNTVNPVAVDTLSTSGANTVNPAAVDPFSTLIPVTINPTAAETLSTSVADSINPASPETMSTSSAERTSEVAADIISSTVGCFDCPVGQACQTVYPEGTVPMEECIRLQQILTNIVCPSPRPAPIEMCVPIAYTIVMPASHGIPSNELIQSSLFNEIWITTSEEFVTSDTSLYNIPSKGLDSTHTYNLPSQEVDSSHTYNLPSQDVDSSHTYNLPSQEVDSSHTNLPSQEVDSSHTYNLPSQEVDSSHTYNLRSQEVDSSHTYNLSSQEVDSSHTYNIPSQEVDRSHTYNLPSQEVDSSHTYNSESQTSVAGPASALPNDASLMVNNLDSQTENLLSTLSNLLSSQAVLDRSLHDPFLSNVLLFNTPHLNDIPSSDTSYQPSFLSSPSTTLSLPASQTPSISGCPSCFDGQVCEKFYIPSPYSYDDCLSFQKLDSNIRCPFSDTEQYRCIQQSLSLVSNNIQTPSHADTAITPAKTMSSLPSSSQSGQTIDAQVAVTTTAKPDPCKGTCLPGQLCEKYYPPCVPPSESCLRAQLSNPGLNCGWSRCNPFYVCVPGDSIEVTTSQAPKAIEVTTSRAPEAIEVTSSRAPEAIEVTSSRAPEAIEVTSSRAPEAIEVTSSRAPEAIEVTTSGAPEAIEVTSSRALEGSEVTTSSRATMAIEVTSPRAPEAIEVTSSRAPEAIEVTSSRATEAIEVTTSQTPEVIKVTTPQAPEAIVLTTSRAPEAIELTTSRAPEAIEVTTSRAPEAIEVTTSRTPDAIEVTTSRTQEALEVTLSQTPDEVRKSDRSTNSLPHSHFSSDLSGHSDHVLALGSENNFEMVSKDSVEEVSYLATPLLSSHPDINSLDTFSFSPTDIFYSHTQTFEILPQSDSTSGLSSVNGYNSNPDQPSYQPSYLPSYLPSYQPSYQPSNLPSYQPSNLPPYPPSNMPSYLPSYQPSYLPSYQPSNMPSYQPSDLMTSHGYSFYFHPSQTERTSQLSSEIPAAQVGDNLTQSVATRSEINGAMAPTLLSLSDAFPSTGPPTGQTTMNSPVQLNNDKPSDSLSGYIESVSNYFFESYTAVTGYAIDLDTNSPMIQGSNTELNNISPTDEILNQINESTLPLEQSESNDTLYAVTPRYTTDTTSDTDFITGTQPVLQSISNTEIHAVAASSENAFTFDLPSQQQTQDSYADELKTSLSTIQPTQPELSFSFNADQSISGPAFTDEHVDRAPELSFSYGDTPATELANTASTRIYLQPSSSDLLSSDDNTRSSAASETPALVFDHQEQTNLPLYTFDYSKAEFIEQKTTSLQPRETVSSYNILGSETAISLPSQSNSTSFSRISEPLSALSNISDDSVMVFSYNETTSSSLPLNEPSVFRSAILPDATFSSSDLTRITNVQEIHPGSSISPEVLLPNSNAIPSSVTQLFQSIEASETMLQQTTKANSASTI